jgi:hypothetical protein
LDDQHGVTLQHAVDRRVDDLLDVDQPLLEILVPRIECHVADVGDVVVKREWSGRAADIQFGPRPLGDAVGTTLLVRTGNHDGGRLG